jgi:hypothetical protein
VVSRRDPQPTDHLDFLLSCLYDDFLDSEHLADLEKSSLTGETISLQKIRSVPPHMIHPLLGFSPERCQREEGHDGAPCDCPKVMSAYLIPFPDPRGGWMDHVRIKVFPTLTTDQGTIKYLQPRRSGVRGFFPLATLDAVLRSADPLYIVEGEKKALSVAQLGLPAIGICGIEGWHVAHSRELHPDFDDVGLCGRVVNVIPDGDVRTNPNVYRAVQRLGAALAARGAEGKLVLVPAGYNGIDDYLAATA